MEPVILYSYFRSSAAYRVRIALNLKEVPHLLAFVHLQREGGEHKQSAYREINPQGLIPALSLPDGRILTQSTAIIEYLEEQYPEPPLLPADPVPRAYVRSLAATVACDIHPLNNLRTHGYLEQLKIEEKTRRRWYCHWIHEGFQALEQRIARQNPEAIFCYGDRPGMADCFLIPQIYNAYRFDCDMSEFPILRRIYHNCMTLAAFQKAAPENQPDSE